MKSVFCICLMMLFMDCSQEDLPVNPIAGKFVEVVGRTDTLSFESYAGGKEVMILARGLVEENGHIKPKRASGPYDYQILDHKISLRWHLSSNSAFNDYSFNVVANTLRIGNFYDENAAGTISVFVRLE